MFYRIETRQDLDSLDLRCPKSVMDELLRCTAYPSEGIALIAEDREAIAEARETIDYTHHPCEWVNRLNKVFLRRQTQVLTALRPYESKLHCLTNATGKARLQHPLSPAVRTWHLSPLKVSELIEEPEKQPSPTPKTKKTSKK